MSTNSPLRWRDLLDDGAGIGVVDVDHDFLDRLQALAGDRIGLEQHARTADGQFEALAAHRSISTPSCSSPRPAT
jgi:hypothetical protein